MRQLDLFGMPVEPKKKAEEQPTAIVVQMPSEKRSEPEEEEFGISNNEPETVIEEVEEVEQESNPLSIVEEKEETYQLKKPSIIFENENIGVKIKSVSIEHTEPIAEVETTPLTETEKQIGKRGRKSFKEMDAELDLTEVPDDEVLFSKQYYSISQVAQWFKVNNSLIRYWENEFDVLKPRKNRKGDRLFRPEDVKNLQLIYHLLRQRKFTIEGAKDYLKAHKAKADVNMQLVQSLTKFKSFLLELRANLDA
jgi:DNA-binding transcriptional MerR regulator